MPHTTFAYLFEMKVGGVWLEWFCIPREVWERHLGAPFEARDFAPLHGRKQPMDYADTWDVMF